MTFNTIIFNIHICMYIYAQSQYISSQRADYLESFPDSIGGGCEIRAEPLEIKGWNFTFKDRRTSVSAVGRRPTSLRVTAGGTFVSAPSNSRRSGGYCWPASGGGDATVRWMMLRYQRRS